MTWAVANANLALVKYWGKEPDRSGNQPAAGSLSVTLEGLSTAVQVCFDPRLSRDLVNWLPSGPSEPVIEFLEQVRSRVGVRDRARVTVVSNFPVAAGLASSASTFAALAVASTAAAGTELAINELAALAREGSGSACRSLLGGFVEWKPSKGGSEIIPIAPQEHWPLEILIAVTSEQPKRVGSRKGMIHTAATSPYYQAWLEAGSADLESVRDAICRRDLSRLGRHIERNCLRMHAAAIAADPPLLYWEPATIAVVRTVWELRAAGLEAYFSIDAGPQVKILCEPAASNMVEVAVRKVPGVLRVIRSRPGGAAAVLAAPPSWTEDVAAR
jgi:diphosphomevalonate decarboxylase